MALKLCCCRRERSKSTKSLQKSAQRELEHLRFISGLMVAVGMRALYRKYVKWMVIGRHFSASATENSFARGSDVLQNNISI